MNALKGQDKAVAVLASGGIESAALLAEALRRYERVYPIYVRSGFRWEAAELGTLRKFLSFHRADGLARLTVLETPHQALYERHWSFGKMPVPGKEALDEAVYLPGRNLMLLSLAGTFCAVRRISSLWIGILKGNPFRDARSGFLERLEGVLQEALEFSVQIVAPLRELTKDQVIRRWPQVPWVKTFSCIKPAGERHCGRCQKCGERQAGFERAGIFDPTRYGTEKELMLKA